MRYQFKTTTTMKEYNSKKWWIDSDIVREIVIDADNLENALKQYRDTVKEKYYIEISDHALRIKNPMYIDTADGSAKQIGYVITGKTDFENRDRYKWSTQYINLWVSIHILQDVFSEV